MTNRLTLVYITEREREIREIRERERENQGDQREREIREIREIFIFVLCSNVFMFLLEILLLIQGVFSRIWG